MQIPSFIFKNRFDTYYFRQRTPKDILDHLPNAKNEVKFSLKNKDKSTALVLARCHKAKFDAFFEWIRDEIQMYQDLAAIKEDGTIVEDEVKLLEQRAIEAINDQCFTQQIFFLFERKNRISDAFNYIEALQGYSLNDIDLSTVKKINQFIAIIDLLSDPTLSDPLPYVSQIDWKQRNSSETKSPASQRYAELKIARLVIKRNQKSPPSPQNSADIKKQSSITRKAVGKTMVKLLDSDISTGAMSSVRTGCDDVHHRDDVVLENISIETEQDALNFAKLFSLIESGGEVNVADLEKVSKPIVVPQTMLKLSELFQKFYNERKSEWTNQKTHSINLAIFNSFIEIVGDIFTDQLDFEHVRKYIEVLQKLPANRNKQREFRDKSIEEIIALEDTFEPMKSQNVNKYVFRISEAFEWGSQRKFIRENYIKGMKVKDKASKQKASLARERFDLSDLTAIFNSKQYLTGCHKRTYQHWLPLLGLYTGARLQELSQLRLNDIYKKDKIWVFDINEEEDKSVKTVNSVRLIPIHKALISLGFIEYFKHIKLCYESKVLSTTHLFPDLIRGRDGYGHNSAKWFNTRYLTQIKIKEDGKSFHSFRHTFADEHKQKLVKDSIVSELLGHGLNGESYGRYGKDYAVTTLKKTIDDYSPLSNEQLKLLRNFRFWKEFEPKNSLIALPIIDKNKTIYSDKHLVKALNERLL
jgi:integrase